MSLPELQEKAFDLLTDALANNKFGKMAVVTSFGAEASVLLHMISRIDKNAPFFFIDTRMLFQETLDYRNTLSRHLGLTNVRTISPEPRAIRRNDVWGNMHENNPDGCCDFRKTSVLEHALVSFDGWITGRKRFQATTRSKLEVIETSSDGKTKLNPLADWSADDLAEYMEWYDLPQHPLVNHGYLSIGCATCTSPVKKGEDARAGRWRGMKKIECGIHLNNGKTV